jgi:hypothetical protein
LKKKLVQHGHDHVQTQEMTIRIIIKKPQSKQGVCRKNVEDDFDFEDYIMNPIEE